MKYVVIAAPRPRARCAVYWVTSRRPERTPPLPAVTLEGVDFGLFFRL